MVSNESVFNRNFIILNLVLFLSYCNITVFFQFPFYLQHNLKVAPQWIGIVISVFSLTGLVVRPFASALITSVNSRKFIITGSIAAFTSLIFYSFAENVEALLFVRIFHGFAYVLLGTAVITEIVATIPTNRSAKAFSILGIITLLPFAIMPPLLKPLTEKFSFVSILLYFGILLLLIVFLVPFLKKSMIRTDKEKKAFKIGFVDVLKNFQNIKLNILFIVALLLFTTFSATFFYIKGYGIKNNMSNPGWFFTIATAVEIGIRFFLGTYLDKVNKVFFLALSLVLMTFAFLLLGIKYNLALFLFIALVFGTGMGVAMPLINSLIFDFSEPKLRGLNSNISIEMFQGGFFIGALTGGIILSKYGYNTIFVICGIFCAISASLVFYLNSKTQKNVT